MISRDAPSLTLPETVILCRKPERERNRRRQRGAVRALAQNMNPDASMIAASASRALIRSMNRRVNAIAGGAVRRTRYLGLCKT